MTSRVTLAPRENGGRKRTTFANAIFVERSGLPSSLRAPPSAFTEHKRAETEDAVSPVCGIPDARRINTLSQKRRGGALISVAPWTRAHCHTATVALLTNGARFSRGIFFLAHKRDLGRVLNGAETRANKNV